MSVFEFVGKISFGCAFVVLCAYGAYCTFRSRKERAAPKLRPGRCTAVERAMAMHPSNGGSDLVSEVEDYLRGYAG